jgi:hypothetical protein
MKVKLGFVIPIICAFVLGTCSTWEGDEGVVNIRIVGEKGNSLGGGSSRTIVKPYPDEGDDFGAYGEPNEKTPAYPYDPLQDEIFKFQLKHFTYDIYFVKKVYPTIGYTTVTVDSSSSINIELKQPKDNNSIPKDNIGGGRKNVKYGGEFACSLVPGTWILIINGSVTKEDGVRAQGVVYPVEIKPGKNEDIEIEMLYTRVFEKVVPTGLHTSTYIAPIINEIGVILTKGANF